MIEICIFKESNLAKEIIKIAFNFFFFLFRTMNQMKSNALNLEHQPSDNTKGFYGGEECLTFLEECVILRLFCSQIGYISSPRLISPSPTSPLCQSSRPQFLFWVLLWFSGCQTQHPFLNHILPDVTSSELWTQTSAFFGSELSEQVTPRRRVCCIVCEFRMHFDSVSVRWDYVSFDLWFFAFVFFPVLVSW